MTTPPAPVLQDYAYIKNDSSRWKPNRDTLIKVGFAVAFFFGFVVAVTSGVGHIGILGTSGIVPELAALGAITTKVASFLSMTPHGACIFFEVFGVTTLAGSAAVILLTHIEKNTLSKSVKRLARDLGYKPPRESLSRTDLKENFYKLKNEYLVKALGLSDEPNDVTPDDRKNYEKQLKEEVLDETLRKLPNDLKYKGEADSYSAKLDHLVTKKGITSKGDPNHPPHYTRVRRHGIELYMDPDTKNNFDADPVHFLHPEETEPGNDETLDSTGIREVKKRQKKRRKARKKAEKAEAEKKAKEASSSSESEKKADSSGSEKENDSSSSSDNES